MLNPSLLSLCIAFILDSDIPPHLLLCPFCDGVIDV